jgi:hypothetical protein
METTTRVTYVSRELSGNLMATFMGTTTQQTRAGPTHLMDEALQFVMKQKGITACAPPQTLSSFLLDFGQSSC